MKATRNSVKNSLKGNKKFYYTYNAYCKCIIVELYEVYGDTIKEEDMDFLKSLAKDNAYQVITAGKSECFAIAI